MPRSNSTAIRFLGPLIVLWTLPAVAFLVTIPLASRAERLGTSSDTSSAMTVTVGSRTVTLQRAAEAVVEFQAATRVLSPTNGTITGLSVTPGSRLQTGTLLGRIDGIPVYASGGDSPIYRDLRTGMSGADVVALTSLLYSLKHVPQADLGSSVTPAIAAGIRSFQKSIGESADGVFRARYAAHIPALAVVKSVALQVGEQTALGGTLVTLEQRPSSVTFPISGRSGKVLDPLAEKPLLLTIGSRSIGISSLAPTPEELPALYDFLLHYATTDPSQSADGRTLRFRGFVLSLRHPQEVATAPATAVLTRSLNISCLIEVRTTGAKAVSLDQIHALPGELGIVALAPRLAGITVLADASQAPDEIVRQCE